MGQLIKTRNLEIAQTCQKNKFRTLLVLRPEIGKGIVCAGNPGLLLSQGISGSIPLEAENTESLSHTYF